MKADDVIEFFGGAQKAADALHMKSHASIIWWRKHGIPLARQYQIQAKSRGKLKAQEPKTA